MFDIIIEVGIIGLMIYTPLAFGGVTQGSITFLELVSGGLFLVWLAKVFSHRHHAASSQVLSRFTSASILLMKRVWIVSAILFLLLLLVQYSPFPSSLVRIISPATHSLYHEAASVMQTTLSAWLPLSVYAQATENRIL